MSAPVSPSPALAAHREALARHMHDAAGYHAADTWESEIHTVREAYLARADDVLAYFADPEHGLTVETGADALAERGRIADWFRDHGSPFLAEHEAAGFTLGQQAAFLVLSLPPHGLVRDEPSDECCGSGEGCTAANCTGSTPASCDCPASPASGRHHRLGCARLALADRVARLKEKS